MLGLFANIGGTYLAISVIKTLLPQIVRPNTSILLCLHRSILLLRLLLLLVVRLMLLLLNVFTLFILLSRIIWVILMKLLEVLRSLAYHQVWVVAAARSLHLTL